MYRVAPRCGRRVGCTIFLQVSKDMSEDPVFERSVMLDMWMLSGGVVRAAIIVPSGLFVYLLSPISIQWITHQGVLQQVTMAQPGMVEYTAPAPVPALPCCKHLWLSRL